MNAYGKTFSGIGAIFLSLAIVLGAWNSHGMEQYVQEGLMSEKYIKTFYTGVQYQFICSLGLLILGFKDGNRWLQMAIWLIFLGMIIFSFSLYFLAFNEILGASFKKLGAVAPFGGLAMAAGWLLAGISILKNK